MVVNNEAAVSKENQEEKRKTTRFKNQSGSRMIKQKKKVTLPLVSGFLTSLVY